MAASSQPWWEAVLPAIPDGSSSSSGDEAALPATSSSSFVVDDGLSSSSEGSASSKGSAPAYPRPRSTSPGCSGWSPDTPDVEWVRRATHDGRALDIRRRQDARSGRSSLGLAPARDSKRGRDRASARKPAPPAAAPAACPLSLLLSQAGHTVSPDPADRRSLASRASPDAPAVPPQRRPGPRRDYAAPSEPPAAASVASPAGSPPPFPPRAAVSPLSEGVVVLDPAPSVTPTSRLFDAAPTPFPVQPLVESLSPHNVDAPSRASPPVPSGALFQCSSTSPPVASSSPAALSSAPPSAPPSGTALPMVPFGAVTNCQAALACTALPPGAGPRQAARRRPSASSAPPVPCV